MPIMEKRILLRLCMCLFGVWSIWETIKASANDLYPDRGGSYFPDYGAPSNEPMSSVPDSGLPSHGNIEAYRETLKKQSLEAVRSFSASLGNSTVDIISVGSNTRISLLQAQADTFASHISVRNYFPVTEADDDDPDCAKKLTYNDTLAISKICRNEDFHEGKPYMQKTIRKHFSSERYLRVKANAPGWICAQKRPIQGLRKAMAYYEELRSLPDYLIIMDDDTYYNMDAFVNYFTDKDPRKTAMLAPCILTRPVRYGHGGFGSIWTRGLLEAVMKPIHCDIEADKRICGKIRENNIGETQFFEDGMSLFQLVSAYASQEKFVNYKNWRIGFCMHSDFLWGYLMHLVECKMTPRYRIQGWTPAAPEEEGNEEPNLCINEYGNCNASSPVCHYQTAEQLERYHQENLALSSRYLKQ